MTVAATHDLAPEFDALTSETLVLVLDALPVCAFLVEKEEVSCNHAMERLTGYGRQEIFAARNFFSLLFGAGGDEVRTTFEADRAVGSAEAHEFSITCKDGSKMTVVCTVSGTGRLLCTMQDVTERRRLEQELRMHDISKCMEIGKKQVESEALLKAVIQAVPFDFFALDLAGRYTMLSTATSDAWGNAVGKTVQELTAGTPFEKYAPRWLENNRRALAGETIQRECVYERQGEEHVVQETIGPIRDPQQRILGSFGINVDITHLKLTQKALKESEERYRCLAGLTSDYVYCCTRRGEAPFRVQWMDGAVKEITGYSETEIFDMGCWIGLVHPDDRGPVVSRVAGLRPGPGCTDEFRIVRKDGEIRWIREYRRCEAGEVEGELRLYGACRDITASKQAQIALENIEEIFRLFLDYIPAYVIFKDEDHKIVRLSKNFEALLGKPAREIVGKTAADLFPPELAERTMQDDLRVLKGGRPTQMEEELQGRFYSSLKFCIPQHEKRPLLVSIRTDITDRREAEDALFRLNSKLDRMVVQRTAQLENAILEQESFSYSVSHDLRAPLRHINCFSGILLEEHLDSLPDQARDYLTRICQATTTMGVLIDNLLELSRVSRTLMQRSPVNLSELVATVARMLKETEPERSVEVIVGRNLYAICDQILVQQLFENLLGNAWKYTARTPDARIEFGQVPGREAAVFFIKDNGAGFNMDYKDKLFIPFQRLHGSEFEGNGIGLATAQRIVQRHGGSIWAEGEEGGGAMFFFTLP